MLGNRVLGFGPTPNNLLFIGEAPGAEEDEQGRPFVGAAGQELRRMLATIGVKMDECYRTNVFSQRPPNNDLKEGYGCARDHPNACLDFGALTHQPVTTYLDRSFVGHLKRLYEEIEAVNPNVIVALGNTACWALGLGQGIGNLRGTIHVFEHKGREYKVLPTFHPSAVVREWSLRTIAITDLEKARQESVYPDLRFDNTELWLSPELADLEEFGERYLEPATECAFDVETKQGQITCLSFAPTVDRCIVVPFWIEGPDPHYWTLGDEILAWRWVQKWVERPTLTKVTQSGLYDVMYLRMVSRMNPAGFSEDTMLAHHALFCEMRKSLGFLGSLYASVPSWKQMRTFKREDFKRDD